MPKGIYCAAVLTISLVIGVQTAIAQQFDRVPDNELGLSTSTKRTAQNQIGEDSAKQAYARAARLDTREAWQAFLNQYTKGIYHTLAKGRLDELERMAKRETTFGNYFPEKRSDRPTPPPRQAD